MIVLQKRKKIGVRVNKHDEALFKYLYEYKVATVVQIQRDIYRMYDTKSVYNRLIKLMRNGFLKSKQFPDLDGRVVYSLGKSGFRRFAAAGGQALHQELSSAVVFHDLGLLEIRHRLGLSKSVRAYYSENMLKSKNGVPLEDALLLTDIHPDAVVEIHLDEKSFLLPLEFESSRKYENRYAELFGKYYRNQSIAGVLYICADEALLKRIQSYEQKNLGASKPKFFYSDFSKWNQANECVFTNLKGSSITLK